MMHPNRSLWLCGSAAALTLAATLSVTHAQQPAASSPWVKLCEKAQFMEPDPKDATKGVQKERNICITHHERIDAAAGSILLSVAVREVEGVDKKSLTVLLPLGVAIRPGVQVGIFPADMWAAIAKGDNVDDSKLERLSLGYTMCITTGCTAEIEATPDVIKRIQGGAGMVVFAINGSGDSFGMPAPLNGFSEALAGAPQDNKAYYAGRLKLKDTVDQNRKAMIDEYRKQNKELQSLAPKPQAPAATPASAPAAAPAAVPAAKKP